MFKKAWELVVLLVLAVIVFSIVMSALQPWLWLLGLGIVVLLLIFIALKLFGRRHPL